MKKTFVASLITAAATFVALPTIIYYGLYMGLLPVFSGAVNIVTIMLALSFVSTIVVFILSTIVACKKGEVGKGLAITSLVFKAILAISLLVVGILLIATSNEGFIYMLLTAVPFVFLAAASAVGFAFTLTDLVKKA